MLQNEAAMRTERQIHAARENGKKSRGPVTPEGKRNSARNSIHHGLHAQTLLLEGERPEFFNQLVNSLHEEFQPQTASEIATVESMAWARWRQKRLWSFEQAAINQEIRTRQAAFPGTPPERNEACARAADAFSTLADNSKALHLMHRCETSCDRQFSRALRRLAELRGGDPRPKRDPGPDQSPQPDPGPANVEISERTPEVAENTEYPTAAEPDANPISVTPDPELASEDRLPDPGPEEPIHPADGGLHTSPANPESVRASHWQPHYETPICETPLCETPLCQTPLCQTPLCQTMSAPLPTMPISPIPAPTAAALPLAGQNVAERTSFWHNERLGVTHHHSPSPGTLELRPNHVL